MTIATISRENLRKHRWESISHADSIEKVSQALTIKIVSFLRGRIK